MIRLAVRVRRERAEVALAELLALAPGGVEEVDLGERVEYAVYGAPGELPALPALRAAVGDALVEVSTSEVADDWAERWRDFHRPVLVARRIRIRPPWIAAEPGSELVEIVIDPGAAFGTGAHATTRLCAELLAGLQPAGSLADVGCGSGVLAIVAAKLGWGPVAALDNDPAAVAAARANCAANDVVADVRRADLRREPVPRADVLIANLVRPLLLELAATIGWVPQVLIAGGLLAGEGDEVCRAFARHGLAQRASLAADGWEALLLAQPSSSDTVTSS